MVHSDPLSKCYRHMEFTTSNPLPVNWTTSAFTPEQKHTTKDVFNNQNSAALGNCIEIMILSCYDSLFSAVDMIFMNYEENMCVCMCLSPAMTSRTIHMRKLKLSIEYWFPSEGVKGLFK